MKIKCHEICHLIIELSSQYRQCLMNAHDACQWHGLPRAVSVSFVPRLTVTFIGKCRITVWQMVSLEAMYRRWTTSFTRTHPGVCVTMHFLLWQVCHWRWHESRRRGPLGYYILCVSSCVNTTVSALSAHQPTLPVTTLNNTSTYFNRILWKYIEIYRSLQSIFFYSSLLYSKL